MLRRRCAARAPSRVTRATPPPPTSRLVQSFPSRHSFVVSSEVVMTRSVLPAAALSALAAAVVPVTAQAPVAPAAAAVPSVTVVIKAGRLVDPRAGTTLTTQAILVEGERIKEVGPARSEEHTSELQ